MSLQAFLALGVLRMPTVYLLQAISHEELVVPRGEDGRRDIDEDADPRVPVVEREGLLAEEDGRDHSRAQVPCQVRRDGIPREPPDHGRVCDADREGDRHGADERVRRVQARPDDDADVAVHKPFLQKQVSLVRLVWVRERAENTGHAAVVHRGAVLAEINGLGRLDLRPVAAHQQQTGHEGAKDLRKDVMRHFLPREPLPNREADRDGWVEVTTRNGSTCLYKYSTLGGCPWVFGNARNLQ